VPNISLSIRPIRPPKELQAYIGQGDVDSLWLRKIKFTCESKPTPIRGRKACFGRTDLYSCPAGQLRVNFSLMTIRQIFVEIMKVRPQEGRLPLEGSF